MAEEEQQDVHGGMEPFEAGSADGEEDMEVTTEIKPTLSADDIENAKVEAEKERKRQERLKGTAGKLSSRGVQTSTSQGHCVSSRWVYFGKRWS